jgi:Ca2+-binding RTX toxin-like protein
MNLEISYTAHAQSTAPAAFFNAVNYVVNLFDATFTNNATVNIQVGYGDFPLGGTVPPLGESEQATPARGNYSQVRNALIAEGAAGSATLPVNSPISGSLELPTAQEKALGIIPSNNALDGWIGIASSATLASSGLTWSFDPTATPSSSQYYIVGVIEHEISEVMGRTSFLDIPREYGVIDLYRYQAANTRQLSGTGNPSYFSTDNGVTATDYWNNPQLDSGDLADWARGPADAFLNRSIPAQINGMTQADLLLMSALGWDVAGLSPPVITQIAASPASGVVGLGQQVMLTLTMSAAVTVAGGMPSLTLNDGGTATYVAGSGTTALTFVYTVAAGQGSANLMVTAVNPNGATIADTAGNRANLSLAGLVQGGPTIVTSSSSPLFIPLAPNASYIASQSNLTVQGGGGTMNVTLHSAASVYLADGGNDLVAITGSNDTVVGSSGKLTVDAITGSVSVVGGTGPLLLNVGGSAVTLRGGMGAVTVAAGGSTGPLLLGTGAGRAMVEAGAGSSTIFAGTGGGNFWGGSGNFLFVGGSGGSTIVGGSGRNVMWGGHSGSELMFGGSGQNTMVGGGSGTVLIGGGIQGSFIAAGPGSETLVGSPAGNDILFAGSGPDTIFGGGGKDTLVGGDGTVLYAGSGPDMVFGGSGKNTLVGADGSVLIGGGTQGNVIVAGSGNETLASSPAGNDLLFAGAANGLIFTGAGDDSVFGGTGTTQIVAGPGHGTFVFYNGGAGGSAVIWGFVHGADHVQLSGYAPNVVQASLQNASLAFGNTTITLPDNTRITFGSLQSLTASDFA